jgi:hypothetical protein
VSPVDIAGIEGLLDQQPAETRAIDEQLAGYFRTIFELNRFDKTGLG